jgi:hypothetical protein
VSNAILEQKNSAIVLQKNTRAVAHAVAQQELEGLNVSPASLNDMRRAALGDISEDDVIANIYAVRTCLIPFQLRFQLLRSLFRPRRHG